METETTTIEDVEALSDADLVKKGRELYAYLGITVMIGELMGMSQADYDAAHADEIRVMHLIDDEASVRNLNPADFE